MRKTLGLVILGAAFLTPAASAASLGGVTVPDTVQVSGQPLVLNGVGLRTKFFIKVYVGALYLPARQSAPNQILAADSAREMSLNFVYSVSHDQLCDAWKEGLEDNLPNASAEVKKSFDTLCSWMEAIPNGKSLNLTYTPGQGTAVEINGQVKGTLPGKATSDALLLTWIGHRPGPGEDFKRAVLGGHS